MSGATPQPAAAPPHIPGLLDEVVAALDPKEGGIIVDATFGAGGYTRALLDCGATVHAFDRDPNAISEGRGWAEARLTPPRLVQIGRASCRERVCQYGWISVFAVSLKKKTD